MILISSKLGGDITLSADETTITSSVDVVDDFTLNLNGKKLLYSGNNWLFNVYDDGFDGYDSENNLEINDPNNKTILTIEGDGEISATGACIATVGEGGEIIINGGIHITTGATLYNTTGGDIYINKGKFSSSDATQIFTQSDNGRIKITGGSFYQWNPENYKVENAPIYFDAQDDDVVTHDSNDWYHIKKYVLIDNDKSADNKNELKDALANEEVGKIDLTGPYSFNAGNNTSDPNQEFGYRITHDIEIDFGNIKSTVTAGRYAFLIERAQVVINNMNLESSDCIAILPNSDVVFNGNKINFKGTNSGGRYCFYVESSKLTINGGEFNNVGARSSDRYMWALGTAEVKINGGAWGFANTTTPSPIMYVEVNAKLEITGGTFNFNPDLISHVGAGIGTIIITGGTFTSSTEPKLHLAEGYKYELVAGTTNKWKVVPVTTTNN